MFSQNRFNSIILLLIAFFITASCSKNEEVNINEYDYLIFGHFYGECDGEGCIETYMLTDTKLFEDRRDNYFLDNAQLDFVQLDQDKFELVKDLPEYIPVTLLEAGEDVIGCPDCGDWGGLSVQYSKDNIVKSWRIDLNKENVPASLHEFIDKVEEKITLINE